MKRRLALAMLIAQFVLVAPALRGSGSEPTTALVAPEPILVAGGTGSQTEAHVSGSLVSFTNQGSTTSEIRYKDVATTWPSAGIDNSTPTGSTYRDSISDVSGSVIVFKRASDFDSTESIMFFDSANPSAGPQVLANAPGSQRQAAAIGGTTVAFEQKTSSTLERDICVASITTPDAPATCLTDSLMNRDPAVSPDGNTVVWSRCTGLLSGCDIWGASKNADGVWDASRAITIGGGNDTFPDTNGVVVTYASNLDGDSDIYFQNLDGTGLIQRIVLADSGGSSEENPNISGTRISFQRRAALGQPADLYVYHLVSDTLYQLTETPAADEKLSDISTSSSGQNWVVWAAVDPATNSDDVWAASFWLPDPVPETSYEVCPLFDQSRSHRLGSTVPVRIQLCDPDGTNRSSPSLMVIATALAKVDGTASTVLAADDSGHANPDNDFRYDDSLQGYIYNLATRGLSSGTWELQFTVSGDPATYAVRFDIR